MTAIIKRVAGPLPLMLYADKLEKLGGFLFNSMISLFKSENILSRECSLQALNHQSRLRMAYISLDFSLESSFAQPDAETCPMRLQLLTV